MTTPPLGEDAGQTANVKMWINLRILFLGGLFSKLIAFLLVPVYARVLQPEGFGTLELITTSVDLLFPILSLSLYEGLFRIVMLDTSQAGRALSSVLPICIGGALTGVALIPVISWVPGIDELAWSVAALFSLVMFNSVFGQFVRGMGDALGFALGGVIQGVTLALLAIILLIPVDLGIVGLLLAMLGSYCCSIVFFWVRGHLWREVRLQWVSKSVLRVMLTFSLPLVLNGALWWVVNSVSRFFLSTFRSLDEVGQFAGATRVTFIISTFVLICLQAWQMSVNEEHHKESFSVFVKRFYAWFAASLMAISCLVSVLARPLIDLMLGDQFEAAVSLVPLLVLMVAFSSISAFLSSINKAKMKTLSILHSSVLSAMVVVGLNWLLVPGYGALGAAIAGVCAFAALTAYRWVDASSLLTDHLPWGRTALSLGVLALLCLGSFVDTSATWHQMVAALAAVATLVLHQEAFRELASFGMSRIRRRV